MKKFFLTLMSAVTIFLMTACGSSNVANGQSKILVAFFSASGNTAELAENLSKAINADLYEIKPKVDYTSADLDWHNKNSRSSVEMNDENSRPEISGKVENFAQYEKIIIAYPIWWNLEPRIVDTFLESYDFSGKILIPICTSGGSGIENSESHMKKICPNATWKSGQRFSPRAAQSELKSWFDKI